MSGKVYFREVQRFRQVWLWGLLIAIALLFAYGGVQQILFGKPWGNKPLPDAGLVAIFLLFVAILTWLYSVRLVTEVNEAGVVTHFKWLWRRRLIPFAEIRSHAAVTYRPLADYGGWGIRYGFGGAGKAYNVSGNRGVQFELADGGRLLVGSQRADEFDRAVDEAERAQSQPRGAGGWRAGRGADGSA
ncbi:MAG: hypothetical protein QOF61_479 [Acidobacteriota bacterium]|nr:hypothetical protein [Acidobacteriota bacterium]